jgi:ATP-dependent DNA helicase RecQ
VPTRSCQRHPFNPAGAAPSLAAAERVLREHWGYRGFRHVQRRVVVAALQGRDCLAVLPTGGGKSLCYQVPALVLPGLSIVVSPLISLMEDQVGGLRARGVRAGLLSSTLDQTARARTLADARAGRIALLYAAPERLGRLVTELRGVTIARLAIDEAHCISEWGHDFRPHYRAIGRHRRALGTPPTLALTGTATPRTRADMLDVLRLRRPVSVLCSFDRPNLFFAATPVRSEAERLQRTLQLLRSTTATAIVYVPTRNRTDGVASVLRRWGIPALPYHAGLPARARTDLLERFVDGRCRVMVATNAFGMGIDKPDVRLVLHLGVPPRPEAYVQEAGRAGRDGKPAQCLMLWTKGDLVLARALAIGRGRRKDGDYRARQTGLDAMHRYVHAVTCRRRVLMRYLGEEGVRCSGCDRCRLQTRSDAIRHPLRVSTPVDYPTLE